MDNLYELELLKTLPSSISDDKNVQAMAEAQTPELQSVSRDIRETLIISRIDELPEPVIDLLAWQWHVDFYEMGLPLDTKRELVKNSIPWHRKKGTLSCMEAVVKAVFEDGRVREWFEDGYQGEGQPYTFCVETTAGVNEDRKSVV